MNIKNFFKFSKIVDVNQRLLFFDQTITALENRITDEKRTLDEFTHQDLLGGVNITEIRDSVLQNKIYLEGKITSLQTETQGGCDIHVFYNF